MSWQEYGSVQCDMTAIVSERFCDLLLSFPSAAIGGVSWQTLVQKYEERHSVRFDPTMMGHDSTVHTAMSLLSGILRLVDISDAENPIVAAHDGVVMVPHPGALGSWPSLYQALCNAVMNHGTPDEEPRQEGMACGLLLSQLKPLLRVHWHPGFEERCLGCLSDEGKYMRLWKLKHLVQAVIRWRELRMMWRVATGSAPSIVDEALMPTLELVQSKQHSDLVLRCMPNGVVLHHVPGSIVSEIDLGSSSSPELACEMRSFFRNQTSRKVPNLSKWSAKSLLVAHQLFCAPGDVSPTEQNLKQHPKAAHQSTVARPVTCDLEKEATKLRFENEELRKENLILEQQFEVLKSSKKEPSFEIPSKTSIVTLPPFAKVPNDVTESSLSPASVTSTRASEHLSMDFQTTEETMSVCDGDDVQSRSLKVESIDPEVSKRWTKHIPKGIVQQARARFEYKLDDSICSEDMLGFVAKVA